MKLLWKLRTHEPTDQKRFCNDIYLKAVRSALSSKFLQMIPWLRMIYLGREILGEENSLAM